MNTDDLWEWHTGEGDEKPHVGHVIPKHISSPTVHQRSPRTPENTPIDKFQTTGADVVVSTPTHVRVGFFPSVETTNPAELPGSRHDNCVITTPPHPTSPSPAINISRPRAESIEEADKKWENYVPQSARKGLNFSPEDSSGNAFCFELATLIGAQQMDEQPQKPKGRVPETDRKASLPMSDTSNISVSASLSLSLSLPLSNPLQLTCD